MKKAPAPVRHKCRYPYCHNHYDDVIGGGSQKGGDCIPCLYANQMLDHGQTIEQVEGVPHLMEMFSRLLSNTGWTLQHVKESYARAAVSREAK
jgi:hypothetical protein